MRFAIPSLTFLLSLLLTTGLLSAQADPPVETQPNVDNPDASQMGQNPEGDPGHRPSTIQDLQSVGLHGIDVEVLQDPIRIAPGEHGHLILLVRLPKGRTAEKGGQVVMNRTQGPLQLGMPIWDPPPKGKSVYSDIIVIKVPLSIDAKAAYGKPLVQGSVRLRGDFFAMGHPGGEVQITADGGEADPAAPPPDQQPGVDPNRAELGFQRQVHIGPAMAKASRSNRRAGDSKTGGAKGAKSGSGTGGATDGKPAAMGPSDAVPGVGPARTGSRSDEDPEAGPDEEAPDLAEDPAGEFPWWILSVGLVLLAAGSFVIQAKKA